MRKSLLIAASAFVLGAGAMAYIGQTARATTEPKAETYHMLELFGDVLTRSTASTSARSTTRS